MFVREFIQLSREWWLRWDCVCIIGDKIVRILIPHQKLIVLDLDETLIHATSKKLSIEEDFRFDEYFVYKRPHLENFLRNISQHFKIAIWSSADDEYVRHIVKQISPPEIKFELIWGRSRCSHRTNHELQTFTYEKRLEKLKRQGFRLDRVIIVDDSPEKTRTNYGNAIYIKEFTGNQEDEELKMLHDYLLTLKEVENVRTVEKRNWRK